MVAVCENNPRIYTGRWSDLGNLSKDLGFIIQDLRQLRLIIGKPAALLADSARLNLLFWLVIPHLLLALILLLILGTKLGVVTHVVLAHVMVNTIYSHALSYFVYCFWFFRFSAVVSVECHRTRWGDAVLTHYQTNPSSDDPLWSIASKGEMTGNVPASVRDAIYASWDGY